MRELFADDPRFGDIRSRIRWFVAVAVILAVLLLGAIAWKQDFFTPTLEFYFFAPSAHDLNKGMPVKLMGFKIGKVETVSIEPNASVKVLAYISSEYERFIGNDSTVWLSKDGLLGHSVIEIVPGKGGGRQIVNFDVLAFERERGLSDIAQEISDRVKPIIADVKDITGYIRDPEGDVRQTMRNVSRASTALQETTSEVKALASAGRQQFGQISTRTNTVLDKTATAIDHVNTNMQMVEDRLPGMLLKADQSLEHVRDTNDQLNKLTREVREQVPQLVREGRQTLEDAREIMNGLKQSWPISSMLPAPGAPLLPADSHDAVPRDVK